MCTYTVAHPSQAVASDRVSRDQDVAVILRATFAKSPNPTTEQLFDDLMPIYFGLISGRGTLYKSHKTLQGNVRNYLKCIGAREKDGRWTLSDSEPPSEAQVRSVREAALARLAADAGQRRLSQTKPTVPAAAALSKESHRGTRAPCEPRNSRTHSHHR